MFVKRWSWRSLRCLESLGLSVPEAVGRRGQEEDIGLRKHLTKRASLQHDSRLTTHELRLIRSPEWLPASALPFLSLHPLLSLHQQSLSRDFPIS